MKMPPWSYSALTNFENCGWRYRLCRVTKEVPDPPGEMAVYGTRGHLALEERVRDGKELPDEFVKFEPMIQKILSKPHTSVHCERQYALSADFRQVDWWSDEAWVRGVIDLELRNEDKVVLADYKFGKRKPDSDQLKLFAAFVMQTSEEITKCSTGFLWLKERRIDKESFTRDDLPSIWQEFLPRVQRMKHAFDKDKFVKNPSGLCGWCPLSKGQCEFKRERKR